VFCERLCAITPAQAHDRPWVTPDARQVWLCQRGTNRSARHAGTQTTLYLSDNSLYRDPQQVRSDKEVHSKTMDVVRRTTRPMTMNVKPHERNERTQSGYHGLSGATQLGSWVLEPGTEASAETGAVALAFISRKRGTALVRCAYKVCDPLPP